MIEITMATEILALLTAALALTRAAIELISIVRKGKSRNRRE